MDPEKKSNGAIIGLIVIIVILVLGGVYIWKSKVETTIVANQTTNTDPTTNSANASAQLDSLSKELDTTDTNAGVDVNTLK
ncbi:MAG: hypothetical protein WCI76_00990 [bacterium]